MMRELKREERFPKGRERVVGLRQEEGKAKKSTTGDTKNN